MKALLLLLALTLGTTAHADLTHQRASQLNAQHFPKRDIGCPTGSQPAGSDFCRANNPRDTFIAESAARTCPTGFTRAGSGYCRKDAR